MHKNGVCTVVNLTWVLSPQLAPTKIKRKPEKLLVLCHWNRTYSLDRQEHNRQSSKLGTKLEISQKFYSPYKWYEKFRDFFFFTSNKVCVREVAIELFLFANEFILFWLKIWARCEEFTAESRMLWCLLIFFIFIFILFVFEKTIRISLTLTCWIMESFTFMEDVKIYEQIFLFCHFDAWFYF